MEPPRETILSRLAYLPGLYLAYLRNYLHLLAEYRVDTWVAVVAGLIAQAGSLTFMSAVLSRVPALAGWSFYELLFLFYLAITGRALNMVFLNCPFGVHYYIRSGRLDTFMIRPVGPLFQCIGEAQEINGIGSALVGLGVLAFAGAHLPLDWNLWRLSYVGVALLCSMLLQFAILLSAMTIAFWVLEIRSLIYPLSWFYDFTRYPLDIFGPGLRFVLTFVLPFSFGTFYPGAYILRPVQYAWAGWASPAVTLTLATLAYLWWRFGLRHYTSAAG